MIRIRMGNVFMPLWLYVLLLPIIISVWLAVFVLGLIAFVIKELVQWYDRRHNASL